MPWLLEASATVLFCLILDAVVSRFCSCSRLPPLTCEVGNDIRKAVADGYPVQNVIASDLCKGITFSISIKFCLTAVLEFWDLGHELFKSTPESFPAAFITGDAFDPSFLAPCALYNESPRTLPPLTHLTSLTPLQGHVSVIHASSFFHLFSEEKQLQLARAIATLLSPLPGSVIFGSHLGRPIKGLRKEFRREASSGGGVFCHSPESWRELWSGEVFEKGAIRVDAGLKQIVLPGLEDHEFHFLWWSVTRL
jgi:hypothetical protein